LKKTKCSLNMSLSWRRLPWTAATTRWFVEPRHGDDRYDALKNTYEEIRERDARLRAATTEHCRDTNLILGATRQSVSAGSRQSPRGGFSSNLSETVSRVAVR